MELFVLRHGQAEAFAARDSLRELSVVGRREVEHLISANSEHLDRVSAIYTSPYTRARQTAEVVLSGLSKRDASDIQIEALDLLIPAADARELTSFLYTRYHDEKVDALILVGHQPLLGAFVNELCGLEAGARHLQPGSLAALDFEVMAAGCCRLRWLHDPN